MNYPKPFPTAVARKPVPTDVEVAQARAFVAAHSTTWVPGLNKSQRQALYNQCTTLYNAVNIYDPNITPGEWCKDRFNRRWAYLVLFVAENP